MDKFIELMVYFLSDWQHTAIANTRYSVVLIALSIFVGGLFVFLTKRNSMTTMKGLLLQGEEALEQSDKKQEQLLVDHKKNTEQIVELELQVEQMKVKSVQENEEYQSNLVKKGEQYNKELQGQKIEFDNLQTTFKDKIQLNEQLQSKLSLYVQDQEKMVEIEKEYNQLSNEFNSAKQKLVQIEAELNDRNIQIEQFETAIISDTSSLDNKAENENSNHSLQLEMQEQLTQLENIIQQQNQQLAQYNEKLSFILKEPQSVAQEDQKLEENKDGFVNKLLNMISVLDNVDISDKKQTENEASSVNSAQTEDIWQNHKRIIDQIIEKLAIDPFMNNPENNNQGANEEIVNSIENEENDLSAELSEQSNESTVKTDNFQDKLKGFYQKISLMVPKN